MFVRCYGSAHVCLLAVLLHPVAAASEIAETVPPLPLQAAIVRSLASNPDLQAFGFELQAQLGRVQEASARSSPELGVLVENALGDGARSDFAAAETMLSLAFLIEHGARQRRLDVALAQQSSLDAEASVRRLDVAAETARRYLSVLAAQSELAELEAAQQLAQDTLQAVQRRVRTAKAPAAEEARAHAQVARVRLEQEHAEHELAAARRRLAALWGATEADFGPAEGALLQLPPLEAFEMMRGRIERNPEFDRLLSAKRIGEAELRLAELRRRPPWEVTAGVRRFEADDDHALVVGITVPIPNRARHDGAMATARAQVGQTEAERAAWRVRLDAELFALYQELRHAHTQVQMLEEDVLPRMETALEQTRYAYERGRYSYVEWTAAQRELLELRHALLEAATNAHRYRIEIERLTGASLDGRVEP